MKNKKAVYAIPNLSSEAERSVKMHYLRLENRIAFFGRVNTLVFQPAARSENNKTVILSKAQQGLEKVEATLHQCVKRTDRYGSNPKRR